jgi:hypothetical protein
VLENPALVVSTIMGVVPAGGTDPLATTGKKIVDGPEDGFSDELADVVSARVGAIVGGFVPVRTGVAVDRNAAPSPTGMARRFAWTGGSNAKETNAAKHSAIKPNRFVTIGCQPYVLVLAKGQARQGANRGASGISAVREARHRRKLVAGVLAPYETRGRRGVHQRHGRLMAYALIPYSGGQSSQRWTAQFPDSVEMVEDSTDSDLAYEPRTWHIRARSTSAVARIRSSTQIMCATWMPMPRACRYSA